jgi:glucose-1-phosphate adenylyltransferase
MTLPRVLVLVLAGGPGGRLELLTEHRAKAAVPFAGVYRLVDFPLSNCQHAQLPDVWVSAQFHPVSLAEHLANGRPWDLDRTDGGLMMLQPHRGTEREGWHAGTADALWRAAPLIRQHSPDALLVLSADAVYKLDYRQVVGAHLDSDAEATMVTAEVDLREAGRYGVVQLDGDRVRRYDYKPDQPQGGTVSNEVFVFRPDPVLDRLEELARAAGDGGLDDLGTALLPQLAADGAACAYPHDGYWRDVGTVAAYWQAHRDFLASEPPLDLDDPQWPVYTRGGRHSAARIMPGAEVAGSLISGGTRVAGAVHGSVISPGVVIEAGATITDSVLLPGTRVAADAIVKRTVIDDGARIGQDARIGGDGEIALIGKAAHVPAGHHVPPGGRLPQAKPGHGDTHEADDAGRQSPAAPESPI